MFFQLLVSRSVRPSVNCGVSVVETSLAAGYNQEVTNYHHRRHRAHGGLTEDSIILLSTRNGEESDFNLWITRSQSKNATKAFAASREPYCKKMKNRVFRPIAQIFTASILSIDRRAFTAISSGTVTCGCKVCSARKTLERSVFFIFWQMAFWLSG